MRERESVYVREEAEEMDDPIAKHEVHYLIARYMLYANECIERNRQPTVSFRVFVDKVMPNFDSRTKIHRDAVPEITVAHVKSANDNKQELMTYLRSDVELQKLADMVDSMNEWKHIMQASPELARYLAKKNVAATEMCEPDAIVASAEMHMVDGKTVSVVIVGDAPPTARPVDVPFEAIEVTETTITRTTISDEKVEIVETSVVATKNEADETESDCDDSSDTDGEYEEVRPIDDSHSRSIGMGRHRGCAGFNDGMSATDDAQSSQEFAFDPAQIDDPSPIEHTEHDPVLRYLSSKSLYDSTVMSPNELLAVLYYANVNPRAFSGLYYTQKSAPFYHERIEPVLAQSGRLSIEEMPVEVGYGFNPRWTEPMVKTHLRTLENATRGIRSADDLNAMVELYLNNPEMLKHLIENRGSATPTAKRQLEGIVRQSSVASGLSIGKFLDSVKSAGKSVGQSFGQKVGDLSKRVSDNVKDSARTWLAKAKFYPKIHMPQTEYEVAEWATDLEVYFRYGINIVTGEGGYSAVSRQYRLTPDRLREIRRKITCLELFYKGSDAWNKYKPWDYTARLFERTAPLDTKVDIVLSRLDKLTAMWQAAIKHKIETNADYATPNGGIEYLIANGQWFYQTVYDLYSFLKWLYLDIHGDSSEMGGPLRGSGEFKEFSRRVGACAYCSFASARKSERGGCAKCMHGALYRDKGHCVYCGYRNAEPRDVSMCGRCCAMRGSGCMTLPEDSGNEWGVIGAVAHMIEDMLSGNLWVLNQNYEREIHTVDVAVVKDTHENIDAYNKFANVHREDVLDADVWEDYTEYRSAMFTHSPMSLGELRDATTTLIPRYLEDMREANASTCLKSEVDRVIVNYSASDRVMLERSLFWIGHLGAAWNLTAHANYVRYHMVKENQGQPTQFMCDPDRKQYNPQIDRAWNSFIKLVLIRACELMAANGYEDTDDVSIMWIERAAYDVIRTKRTLFNYKHDEPYFLREAMDAMYYGNVNDAYVPELPPHMPDDYYELVWKAYERLRFSEEDRDSEVAIDPERFRRFAVVNNILMNTGNLEGERLQIAFDDLVWIMNKADESERLKYPYADPIAPALPPRDINYTIVPNMRTMGGAHSFVTDGSTWKSQIVDLRRNIPVYDIHEVNGSRSTWRFNHDGAMRLPSYMAAWKMNVEMGGSLDTSDELFKRIMHENFPSYENNNAGTLALVKYNRDLDRYEYMPPSNYTILVPPDTATLHMMELCTHNQQKNMIVQAQVLVRTSASRLYPGVTYHSKVGYYNLAGIAVDPRDLVRLGVVNKDQVDPKGELIAVGGVVKTNYLSPEALRFIAVEKKGSINPVCKSERWETKIAFF